MDHQWIAIVVKDHHCHQWGQCNGDNGAIVAISIIDTIVASSTIGTIVAVGTNVRPPLCPRLLLPRSLYMIVPLEDNYNQ